MSVSSAKNAEVAEKLERFRSVYIPYPVHTDFQNRCDYLQKLGVRTRHKAQMGMRVLAPTGSGKTTAADRYMEIVERRRPRSSTSIPVVKVNLERASTSKKLMISILDQFGDPFSTHGNELILKRRVFACFQRFKTELLFVDEVQHLNFRSGAGGDVTDTLKGLLDGGLVPIVFMGTEDARSLFTRNLQLNGRLLAPCDFAPLQVTSEADRSLFAGFVERLERVLVDEGIFPEASALREAGLLPALFEVSKGVIGRVVRLFQAALEIAIRRDARRIEPFDFAEAIDRWAIPQGFIDQNPIRRC